MDGDAGAAPVPELCDLCGLVISDDSQLYALVPDAGAVLSQRQLITACSAEHLERLRRSYG